MKDLMKTNVYDVSDTLVIVGSCLERMQPKAFKKLKEFGENIYDLCLEEVHINMAVSKLCGMLARVNVKKIIFATIDGSPHCVQMHYIENEIKKIMKLDDLAVEHYVAVDDKLIKIENETIKLSKSLCKLQNLIKTSN